MANSSSVESTGATRTSDEKHADITRTAGSTTTVPEPIPISAGANQGRQCRTIMASFLMALTIAFPGNCNKPRTVVSGPPPQVELLELSNRPLIPANWPSSLGQAETSSLVIPEGKTCPNGCVFVGYGNSWSASLMRGEMSCLGEPNCMQPIELAPDAPGGVVTGVGEIINLDETKQPSLGGKLVGGVCEGGTPSTQNIYQSGGGTDNVLARASDGSLIYARAGMKLFPDTEADCVLDLRVGDLGWAKGPEPSNSFRQVNIVYRATSDGKTWASSPTQVLTGTATGDPQTHSGLDRFDLYANPFDKTLYVSGGAGTGKRGVNTSLLFASTDNGQNWVKRGSPLDNGYGAYPPLILAATKNRLFAAVCADTVYPPLKPHPVLGWSADGGKTWTTSEGGPLSDYQCDSRVPTANLAGGGFNNLTTDISIAPVDTKTKTDRLRMAFLGFQDDTDDKADRQKLVVLNLIVTENGELTISPVMEIEAPNKGSIVRSGFVGADPSQLPDKKGINYAVLWWLESDNPNFTTSARMRANFLVSYAADNWGKPQPLAVRSGTKGEPPVVPVEWAHDVNSWGGDYNNGSFFFQNNRLNFFITWPQHDATNNVPRIHYNIVAVGPKPIVVPDFMDLGVITLRRVPELPVIEDICAGCPRMQLTFNASRSGPVEVTLTENGRALAPFKVQAKAGINVFRLGDPRREPPSEGASTRFTVALQAAGRPRQLAQTFITSLITSSGRADASPKVTGTRPSEPVRPAPRVMPRKQ